MQTSEKTSHETDTSRYTFSLVVDGDVQKTCFFHVELKSLSGTDNFSQFHHGTII